MDFVCDNLDVSQAGTVFPLVREALPGLTLKAWLAFARRHVRSRRTAAGIMLVRRQARSHPSGLFVYRRENDLTHGPILVAEHLVAVDVLDAAPVLRALLAEMDALARRLGCNAIRTVLVGPEQILTPGLTAAGHAQQGETLWKQLSAGTTPRP